MSQSNTLATTPHGLSSYLVRDHIYGFIFFLNELHIFVFKNHWLLFLFLSFIEGVSPVGSDYIDLLRVIGVPSQNVTFSPGIDSFPAFSLDGTTILRDSANALFGDRIYENFALTMVVKIEKLGSSYIFAVVDSTSMVIQLGVGVASLSHNVHNVTLYYTPLGVGSPYSITSKALASFKLYNLLGHWARINFRVKDDIVQVYVNGTRLGQHIVRRSPLSIEAGSTIYIGQAGRIRRGTFVVSTEFF